jgi:hypothetical protein
MTSSLRPTLSALLTGYPQVFLLGVLDPRFLFLFLGVFYTATLQSTLLELYLFLMLTPFL